MNQAIKNILTIKHLWGGIVPIHIFGLLAIYNVVTGHAPEWWWMAVLVGWFFMKFVGISAGFHRLFSHHSYEVSKTIKRFILFCGTIAVQGSAILWVGIHRGAHHRHSDTDLDPHSPIHGFWHSYITWMFTLKEGDVSVRRVPDLLRDPDVVFAHKHYIKIVWIVYGLAALVDINLFFYLLVLPSLITLHVFCLQTSVVHYTKLGYRNYQTKDNSINVPWLFLITQGECWHNNHHGNPKNPNYGSKHWWELDPTYWLIKLIRIHHQTVR
jgi:stearoyl-CoA desaturase (delta-9 desaturase)